MATVGQIRDALATRLATISGLRVSDTVVDTPRPPQAVVLPDRIEYDLNANRGADRYEFVISVIVARVDERSAQDNLDKYIVGDLSIKKAVEGDRTLGGVVNTCRVTNMRNYGQVVANESIYLGCEFEVEVIA